jgi:hypothetical protein
MWFYLLAWLLSIIMAFGCFVASMPIGFDVLFCGNSMFCNK